MEIGDIVYLSYGFDEKIIKAVKITNIKKKIATVKPLKEIQKVMF